jgi:hypothetical protein
MLGGVFLITVIQVALQVVNVSAYYVRNYSALEMRLIVYAR